MLLSLPALCVTGDGERCGLPALHHQQQQEARQGPGGHRLSPGVRTRAQD